MLSAEAIVALVGPNLALLFTLVQLLGLGTVA